MTSNRVLRVIKPKSSYAFFHPIKWLVFAFLILIGAYFAKPYLPNDILKYISGGALALALIIYFLNYLFIRSVVYTITDEQILYKRGVFTITTDYIELYRIIDFKETQSFLLRFIGGMNFSMETMDKSHPVFELNGIPKSDIDQLVRSLVEDNRGRKNVFVTE